MPYNSRQVLCITVDDDFRYHRSSLAMTKTSPRLAAYDWSTVQHLAWEGLTRIHYCYFASLEPFARNPRVRLAPHEIPNAFIGYHLTFGIQCLLLAVAIVLQCSRLAWSRSWPYTSLREDEHSFQTTLESTCVFMALFSLWVSYLQAALRALYTTRMQALDQHRDRLLSRFTEFELQAGNQWPPPLSPVFVEHLVQFDQHKTRVVEQSGYMMLTLLVTGAAHIGHSMQSLLSIPAPLDVAHLSWLLVATLALLRAALWITLLDYASRLPILLRFQWLYCTTHFEPSTARMEG